MNTMRPQWLPGQAHFPETQARALIERAYDLAVGNENFDVNNCAALITILHNLRSDASTIAAAVVSQLYKQQLLDYETINSVVGANPANILRALDDLSLIDRLHEQEQSDLEALRKMLLAMAADIRAVILKLALQVVLMRNIANYEPKQQQQLAWQTRDLFAPLANRLGIAQLKWELEDLALRVLEADIYQELSQALEEKRSDRERYIERIINILLFEFKKEDVKINRVYGRVKHINSIYQKMKRKNLRFQQVNDVRAVRVEVESTEDCYKVLSIVNALWLPIGEEFDDYISNPKANGYQSLHCSFIAPENRVLEVQIRTSKMHEHAELGVAAHWLYKEKGARHSQQFEKQIEWLQRILSGGDVSRGDLVFAQFRDEAFKDRVYAISPQGRVVDLPEGATALDFAYHIHTQLGHRCRGAKVNGNIVTLVTPLKNGDTVEILTQKNPCPSRDWLSDHLGYLVSGRAKAKVRGYFKKLHREKNIAIGEEMLERECRRLGMNLETRDLLFLVKQFNVKSEDDLLEAIGFGDVGVLTVVHELAAKKSKLSPTQNLDVRLARIPVKAAKKNRKGSVCIDGIDDLMLNFASCCQPLPPVDIKGFITAGRGVNIHRSDCQNLAHLGKVHPQRIINVSWNEEVENVFAAKIKFQAYDRHHLLRDMTQIVANEKISIVDVAVRQTKNHHLKGHFILEIRDMAQLSRLIYRFSLVKDMLEVTRA